MNELFGIPMNGILTFLVAVLALCLLSVAWVAWRRPVIFKLGVRNIPRRRAQTTLIVIGLMLSTLIISAALGTGDTLNYSTTSEVYKSLGHVDELVVYSPDGKGDASTSLSNDIDVSSLGLVETALEVDENVDGVMPVLWKFVPIVNGTSGLAEPEVGIMGVDPSRLDAFGGVEDLDGDAIKIAALAPNEIVINETAPMISMPRSAIRSPSSTTTSRWSWLWRRSPRSRFSVAQSISGRPASSCRWIGCERSRG